MSIDSRDEGFRLKHRKGDGDHLSEDETSPKCGDSLLMKGNAHAEENKQTDDAHAACDESLYRSEREPLNQPVSGEKDDVAQITKLYRSELPYWSSCRYLLSLVVFYCNVVIYAVRFNLSVTIVCMTVPTNVTDEVVRGEDVPAQCLISSNSSNSYVGGEFEWSKSLQGWILSSFYYGYILSQIPTSWLTQRYGPKSTTLVSMVFVCLTTIMTPLAASVQPDRIGPYVLIALRITLGIASGSCVTAIAAIWGRWAPTEERTLLVGFCWTGNVLGTVIILPLSGYLCEEGFAGGWPSIFYLSGIMTFVACVLWWFLVFDSPDVHPRITQVEQQYIVKSIGHATNQQLSQRIPWKKMFKSMPVYAIMVGGFASGYVTYTLSSNLPMYMEEVLRFDIKTNGFLSSLPFIVEAISSILFSYLADVLRVKTKLTTTHVRKILQCLSNIGPGILVICTGFVTCDIRAVAVVLLTAACALEGAMRSGFLVNPNDLAPRYAGVVFALGNSVAAVSGTVAPLVAGILTPNGSRSEWQMVFYIIGAVSLCGALFFCVFASGEVQEWAKDVDDFKDVSDIYVEPDTNNRKNEENHPVTQL